MVFLAKIASCAGLFRSILNHIFYCMAILYFLKQIYLRILHLQNIDVRPAKRLSSDSKTLQVYNS